MTQSNVLKQTTYTTPDFEFDIEAVDFLTTLDGFIHDIGESPTPETANRVLKELGRYQIITVDHNDQPRWITAPIVLKKQTLKNGLGSRIRHLLTSGGEWKGETVQKDRVEVASCCALPLRIPVSAETKREMKSVDITPTSVKSLVLTLTTIHTMLLNVASSGPIGVFENPYGATNMNRLKGFLEKHNDHSGWGMKDTLRVHTLNTVVDDAVFTVTT